MTYKGNAFGHAFGRELSRANEGALSLIIRAVLFTVLTLCICLLLPANGSALLTAWRSDLYGCAGAYVVVSCVLSMLFRVLGGSLYSYGDLRKGRWALAQSCGASVGKLVCAKYFAGLWATLLPYVLGAVLTMGIRAALGAPLQIVPVLQVLCVGLLTLLCLSSLLAVCGALGMRSKALCAMAAVFSLVLLAGWWLADFFASVNIGVSLLLGIPLGLPLVAAVLFVLSLIIGLAVPAKRVSRFGVEELDDEMLRQLAFPRELEVYQKDGEEYELIFSGADIAAK